jgi:hypothetical protein
MFTVPRIPSWLINETDATEVTAGSSFLQTLLLLKDKIPVF